MVSGQKEQGGNSVTNEWNTTCPRPQGNQPSQSLHCSR